MKINFKPNLYNQSTGGNTMAIAAGILAVSGVITYVLEKNAPDVL